MRRIAAATIYAVIIASTPASAYMSFNLNSGTATCEKAQQARIDYAKAKAADEAETRRLEYEEARICDTRWPTSRYGEPVWLGDEPPHPKVKTPLCRRLERQFHATQRKRRFADTYKCTRILGADGKWRDCAGEEFKFPPLAEKAAQILERAVRENCFFY